MHAPTRNHTLFLMFPVPLIERTVDEAINRTDQITLVIPTDQLTISSLMNGADSVSEIMDIRHHHDRNGYECVVGVCVWVCVIGNRGQKGTRSQANQMYSNLLLLCL